MSLWALPAQPQTRVERKIGFFIFFVRNALKSHESKKINEREMKAKFLSVPFTNLFFLTRISRCGGEQRSELFAGRLVFRLVLHDERRLRDGEQEGDRQEAEGFELDPEVCRLGPPDNLIEDGQP